MPTHFDKTRQEVSCRAMRPFLIYMKERLGQEVLEELARACGLDLGYLFEEQNWISNSVCHELIQRGIDRSGDPLFAFKAGLAAARREAAGSILPLFRSFGNIELAYRKAIEISTAYSKAADFSLLEIRPGYCLVRGKERPGFTFHRGSCEYRQGMLASIPTLFGLPPARLVEKKCLGKEDDACLYEFSWSRVRRTQWAWILGGMGIFFVLLYLSSRVLWSGITGIDGLIGILILFASFSLGVIFDTTVRLRENLKINDEERGTIEKDIHLLEKNYQSLDATAQSLEKAFQDLNENYKGTIRSLVAALDARDRYTVGHSARTARLAFRMGEVMGLSREELDVLEKGGLLHDLGKIGIPDAILLKPGALTESEREVIRQHPLIGYDIIKGIKPLKEASLIVRHHHERFDGKGYPDQIGGADIPLIARIAACAEVYDTIVSTRCYKPSMSKETAVRIIREDTGTHFDPRCVEALLQVVDSSGEESGGI